MGPREKRVSEPEHFIKDGIEGIEAVVVRIGAGEAQLVLVDSEGRWDRWVYGSVAQCTAKAKELGVPDIHEGEYPEKTRVRMNAYQRTRESYEAAAYPEQGVVGPVKPYPENRPRRPGPVPEEKSDLEGTP
ncbi:MAG: hypothetical protein ACRDK3_08760 [Actinomycetota bacterium]